MTATETTLQPTTLWLTSTEASALVRLRTGRETSPRTIQGWARRGWIDARDWGKARYSRTALENLIAYGKSWRTR